MKEAPIDRATLHDPHRAGIRVGQNRLWTVGRPSDLVQSSRDFIERLVPTDGLELAAALRPDAPEWRQQAIAVIRPLDVAIHLGAKESLSERMVGITRDANSPAVLYGDEHRARVRAVVRTSASNDCLFAHA